MYTKLKIMIFKFNEKKINSDLRKIIVDVVTKSGWGHIPSSFSILRY